MRIKFNDRKQQIKKNKGFRKINSRNRLYNSSYIDWEWVNWMLNRDGVEYLEVNKNFFFKKKIIKFTKVQGYSFDFQYEINLHLKFIKKKKSFYFYSSGFVWVIQPKNPEVLLYPYHKMEHWNKGFDPVMLNYVLMSDPDDLRRLKDESYLNAVDPELLQIYDAYLNGEDLKELIENHMWFSSENNDLRYNLILKPKETKELSNFFYQKGDLIRLVQKQIFFRSKTQNFIYYNIKYKDIVYMPKYKFMLFSQLFIFNHQKYLLIYIAWFVNLYKFKFKNILIDLNLENLKYLLFFNLELVKLSNKLVNSLKLYLIKLGLESFCLSNCSYLDISRSKILLEYFKFLAIENSCGVDLLDSIIFKAKRIGKLNPKYSFVFIDNLEQAEILKLVSNYVATNSLIPIASKLSVVYNFFALCLKNYFLLDSKKSSIKIEKLNFLLSTQIYVNTGLLAVFNFLSTNKSFLCLKKSVYFLDDAYFLINWNDILLFLKLNGYKFGTEDLFLLIRFFNLNSGNYNFFNLINCNQSFYLLINQKVNFLVNTSNSLLKKMKYAGIRPIGLLLSHYYFALKLLFPLYKKKSLIAMNEIFPNIIFGFDSSEEKELTNFLIVLTCIQIQEVQDRELGGLEFRRSWKMNHYIISIIHLKKCYAVLNLPFPSIPEFLKFIQYLNFESNLLPARIEVEYVENEAGTRGNWCLVFREPIWELFFEWSKFNLLMFKAVATIFKPSFIRFLIRQRDEKRNSKIP